MKPLSIKIPTDVFLKMFPAMPNDELPCVGLPDGDTPLVWTKQGYRATRDIKRGENLWFQVDHR